MSSAKRSALGRGLGALISDVDNLNLNREHPIGDLHPSSTSVSEIELGLIEPNPFQPRTLFNQEQLEELSHSIKTLGLIQPITVREIEGGRYQIISGERRYRAASMAGLERVATYIRGADDQAMLEMAIVENIQREDLDAIEIALSFQRLIEECSLTQEEMAQRVGKKRATITNYLRLLRLPAEIQLAIRNREISMGHARALLSLESTKEQLKLCDLIIKKGLSVREVENRVSKREEVQEVPEEREKSEELDESYYRLLDFLGRYFDNNISLKRDEKRGGGAITIRFSGEEEVENFLKAIDKINL